MMIKPVDLTPILPVEQAPITPPTTSTSERSLVSQIAEKTATFVLCPLAFIYGIDQGFSNDLKTRLFYGREGIQKRRAAREAVKKKVQARIHDLQETLRIFKEIPQQLKSEQPLTEEMISCLKKDFTDALERQKQEFDVLFNLKVLKPKSQKKVQECQEKIVQLQKQESSEEIEEQIATLRREIVSLQLEEREQVEERFNEISTLGKRYEESLNLLRKAGALDVQCRAELLSLIQERIPILNKELNQIEEPGFIDRLMQMGALYVGSWLLTKTINGVVHPLWEGVTKLLGGRELIGVECPSMSYSVPLTDANVRYRVRNSEQTGCYPVFDGDLTRQRQLVSFSGPVNDHFNPKVVESFAPLSSNELTFLESIHYLALFGLPMTLFNRGAQETVGSATVGLGQQIYCVGEKAVDCVADNISSAIAYVGNWFSSSEKKKQPQPEKPQEESYWTKKLSDVAYWAAECGPGVISVASGIAKTPVLLANMPSFYLGFAMGGLSGFMGAMTEGDETTEEMAAMQQQLVEKKQQYDDPKMSKLGWMFGRVYDTAKTILYPAIGETVGRGVAAVGSALSMIPGVSTVTSFASQSVVVAGRGLSSIAAMREGTSSGQAIGYGGASLFKKAWSWINPTPTYPPKSDASTPLAPHDHQ